MLKRNRFAIFFVVSLIAIMCCSCASNLLKNSYDTLSTAVITSDTSMKVISDLYKSGLLNDNDLKNIEPVYAKYRFAYLATVSALEAYKRYDTSENEDKLIASLTELDNFIVDLTTLVFKYSEVNR